MTVVRIVGALLSLAARAEAQAWLTAPAPRGDSAQATDGSIGCPTTTASASTTVFAAGEVIDVRYWANSSTGGFVRWAIVAQGGAETAGSFDDGVFSYSCIQSGPECVVARSSSRSDTSYSDGYDSDNGGTFELYGSDAESDSVDAKDDDSFLSCGDTITLPSWLEQGDYVLQWTLYGVPLGGESGADGTVAEPQFVSCADITLTPSTSASGDTECISFTGGDRVTREQNLADDRCFLYNRVATTAEQAINDEFNVYNVFGKPIGVSTCGDPSAAATSAPSTETDSSAVAGEGDDEDVTKPGTVSPATDASASGTGEDQGSASAGNAESDDDLSPETVIPASSASSDSSAGSGVDAGDSDTVAPATSVSSSDSSVDTGDDVGTTPGTVKPATGSDGAVAPTPSDGGASGSIDETPASSSAGDESDDTAITAAPILDDTSASDQDEQPSKPSSSQSSAGDTDAGEISPGTVTPAPDSPRDSSDSDEVGSALDGSESSDNNTEVGQNSSKSATSASTDDRSGEESNEDSEGEDDTDADQDPPTAAPETVAPGGRCRARSIRRA